MNKTFRYMLKLKSGKVKYGEGVDLESAIKDAGLDASEVKRGMATSQPTREELKRRQAVKAKRKRLGKKLIKFALEAKAKKAQAKAGDLAESRAEEKFCETGKMPGE